MRVRGNSPSAAINPGSPGRAGLLAARRAGGWQRGRSGLRSPPAGARPAAPFPRDPRPRASAASRGGEGAPRGPARPLGSGQCRLPAPTPGPPPAPGEGPGAPRLGTPKGDGVGRGERGRRRERWFFLGNSCKTAFFKLRLPFARSATVATGKLLLSFQSRGKRETEIRSSKLSRLFPFLSEERGKKKTQLNQNKQTTTKTTPKLLTKPARRVGSKGPRRLPEPRAAVGLSRAGERGRGRGRPRPPGARIQPQGFAPSLCAPPCREGQGTSPHILAARADFGYFIGGRCPPPARYRCHFPGCAVCPCSRRRGGPDYCRLWEVGALIHKGSIQNSLQVLLCSASFQPLIY